MASLLAFPLPMMLGGNEVSNQRAFQTGDRVFRIEWDQFTSDWPISYIISVDGEHYETVHDRLATDVIFEGEVDGFNPDPTFEVIAIPQVHGDPSWYPSGYFTTPLDNKIKFNFDPPASVVDLVSYRIYWDRGTGTVQFTSNFRMAEIIEDGSTEYFAFTPAIPSGTYKFVVRAVDGVGNETTNTAAASQVLINYPRPVSGLSISYDSGTDKATITWVDSPDIGAGNVRVFDNAGSITSPFPDYTALITTVAAGVQSFTSAVLTEGLWVFGFRVDDGTNIEPNVNVIVSVRLDSGLDEVPGAPATPTMSAVLAAGGKVNLYGFSVIDNKARTTKFKFFTNDGAGGAIDFGTPLGAGFITSKERGTYDAAFLLSAAFGETARKFACQAFNASSIASLNSNEVTVTPDATAPSTPINPTTSTDRL